MSLKATKFVGRTGCSAALLVAALGCTGEVAGPPGPAVTPGAGTPGVPGGGTGPGSGGASGNGSGGMTATAGAGAIPPKDECTAIQAVPRRVWRLSNVQYSNVLRDLLKLPAGPEITGGGTSDYAFYSKDTEQVDDRLQFSYYQAAEKLVAQLNPTTLTACQTGEAEQACVERFINGFAAKAFRRPVAPAEIADLLLVYAEGRKKDFATGVRLLVEAVFLAPSFAYRTELGTGTGAQVALTPYEVASQLSFLLLDTLPDEALTAAAADGSLGTDAGVAAQVDRLMALPAAQSNIARIVVDWFGAREVLTKRKDGTLFPAYTPEVQQDLVTATRLFVEDVLWKGSRKFEDLLLSPRIFVNSRLAPIYGFTLPPGTPAGQFVAVEAPAGQRAGILTQPAMMAAKSNPDETSVVHRGKFILNDVLCGVPVPDPPLGLLESEDVATALARMKTERERTEYRMSGNPVCAACHVHLDPYGILFENLDPIGRHRTALPDGSPIQASWDLKLSPSLTGVISSPVQFAEGLLADELITLCATRKMASYALGKDQPQSCELVSIHDRFQASADHSVGTLLREIVLSSFMRTRSGGAQ